MVKLPRAKFVSGDGWAGVYRFSPVDYTSGYEVLAQIRKRTSYAAVKGLPLEAPSVGLTFEDGKTVVVLSLTATQTRAIGRGGILELQVTETGGEPNTLFRQELVVDGDVAEEAH